MPSASPPRPLRHQQRLDGIAMGASALCLLHCLTLPLLLTLLPFLAASVFARESFHLWMLGWVLPSSGLALWVGLRAHRDGLVSTIVVSGLVLLVVAGLRADAWLGETGERVVSACGSLLVMAGHWRNFRLSRAACRPSGRQPAGNTASGPFA